MYFCQAKRAEKYGEYILDVLLKFKCGETYSFHSHTLIPSNSSIASQSSLTIPSSTSSSGVSSVIMSNPDRGQHILASSFSQSSSIESVMTGGKASSKAGSNFARGTAPSLKSAAWLATLSTPHINNVLPDSAMIATVKLENEHSQENTSF